MGGPAILVSHSHRFIYLKTAKTAGTSVEIYFEPLCVPDPATYVAEHATDMKVSDAGVVGLRAPGARTDGVPFYSHMPAADVRILVGEAVWSRYLKFAVVRNPFEKVVSAFWAKNKGEPVLSADALASGTTDFAAVKALFRDWVEDKQGRVSFDREAYAIDGEVVVDHIIRYETLVRDVEAVRVAIGSPCLPPLAHYKGGARCLSAPFSAYYCARTRDLVARAFAWELERFGYAPPDIDAHDRLTEPTRAQGALGRRRSTETGAPAGERPRPSRRAIR